MGSKKGLRLAFIIVIIVIVLTGVLSTHAQQSTGTIDGTVTDEKGAVIPEAAVAITEKSSGRVINVTANKEGYFVARSLPPGSYSVRIEKTGFASEVRDDVIVQTGQVTSASGTLKVGNIAEVVNVEGGEAQMQVNTTSQTLSNVVTAEMIDRAPLNARNFLDLGMLQPSVVIRDGGVIDPTKVNAFRTVGVNGSSGTGTRVQIDGIDVTDETVGTTTANISTDAVNEFQLSRASFDLSTSLTTSGAVNITTRSGSNAFHGSGFYQYRNEKMGARLADLPDKPPFHRDQQGGRFSGPIWKNKFFFFTNYESTYEGTQSIIQSTDFPTQNGTTSLPVVFRYTDNRVDWAINGRTKAFYGHRYSDDLSTGGGGASPFQNVDWTIVHVIGLDRTGARLTHSVRLGYVNFNNRIESRELSPFTFPKAPGGTPFFLGVGSFQRGPNGLAPQQTYQDNKQAKYDGSYILGNHTLRYGFDYNHILLGGFANFAGPLSVGGQFNDAIKSSLGAGRTDPLNYPLDSFSTGPNAGFFTAAPAHNLPHGGRLNKRYAWYVGDSWKVKRNFTLNFGTRWEYDTGFFPPKGTPELSILDRYGPGKGKLGKFPKDAFSPQLGFAWDPKGDGKMSIRGGFYKAFEMNIFNNGIFDEFARLPNGIGPDSMDNSFIHGPDGSPINIGPIPGCNNADLAGGDYTCLNNRPIGSVIGFIERVHQAVQATYAAFKFDPTTGPSVFEASQGVTFGGIFPGDYKFPYSMQFTIGFQRELWKNNVISVDYVRNRGVGLPFLLGEYERRRDASTLNAAAARAKVASVIGVPVGLLTTDLINSYLAANPSVRINKFGLASDSIYTGLFPDLLRARLMTGGFSLYSGLQVLMNGRLSKESVEGPKIGNHSLLRGLNYTVSYALAQAEATSGSNRTEFINNPVDNHNWNSAFGPTGLDRKHVLGAGVYMETIGGFRLSQIWTFRTAPPINLFVPFVDTFASSNGLFTTDLNGDGNIGGGGPRVDLFPGTNIGFLGRNLHNFRDLNQLISFFNANIAGNLTPAGNALVNAGIFTRAQLIALGAAVKPIPLVPLTNPWPFNRTINLDIGIERPIKIKEKITIRPRLNIFNVFNHTGRGQYGGLNGNFGSLNFDYQKGTPGVFDLSELNRSVRGRLTDPRLLQVGIRVDF